MIGKLIKWGLILVVGILIYNYFFGTPEEKETSKKIFSETKELVSSVTNLLKSEKEKFDAGKYDQALDKIGSIYDKLKDVASNLNPEDLDRLKELEQQREELQKLVDDMAQQDSTTEEENAKVQSELEDLLKETRDLLSNVNK